MILKFCSILSIFVHFLELSAQNVKVSNTCEAVEKISKTFVFSGIAISIFFLQFSQCLNIILATLAILSVLYVNFISKNINSNYRFSFILLSYSFSFSGAQFLMSIRNYCVLILKNRSLFSTYILNSSIYLEIFATLTVFLVLYFFIFCFATEKWPFQTYSCLKRDLIVLSILNFIISLPSVNSSIYIMNAYEYSTNFLNLLILKSVECLFCYVVTKAICMGFFEKSHKLIYFINQ